MAIKYECDKCHEQFNYKDNVQTVFFYTFTENKTDTIHKKIENKIDICRHCMKKAFGDLEA